jgi:hypothetical protein
MSRRRRKTLPLAACFAGALMAVNGDCNYGGTVEPPPPPTLASRYVLQTINGSALPALLTVGGVVSTFVLADTLYFPGPLSYDEATLVRIDSAGTQRTLTRTIRGETASRQTANDYSVTLRLPRHAGGTNVDFSYDGSGTAFLNAGDTRTWYYVAR